MRVLVTGGNGFIGSHLVDRLSRLGWQVTVFDSDARRYGSTPEGVRFIRGDLNQHYLVREAMTGIDIVFHLAWATIHETANQNPVADVQANLIPSIHMMEISRRLGVHRFVFVSSGGTVYGPPKTVPTTEDHPNDPITAYGITKLAVEKYLKMFQSLYGFDSVILRPSVPYGPRQNPLGRQGAVAVFLYHVSRGLPITVWGDGSVARDFFYISDLVDALVEGAVREVGDDRIFNLGGVRAVTLNELLGEVEKTVQKRAIVEYQPSRRFDVPRVQLDTRRAAVALGWSPRVSLQEGLAKTWDWMSRAIA